MRFFRSVGVLLVIILAFTAFSAFDCGDGKAVISISISPTTAVILTFDPPSGNTTQTFTASVVYDDQSTGDGTTKVDWESANDAIAYFDENVLMPAAVGTTQVRATAEKGTVVSSWRTVTVRPPFAVLGATASVSDNTIDIGDAVTLTMIASIDEDYQNNNNKRDGRSRSFSSRKNKMKTIATIIAVVALGTTSAFAHCGSCAADQTSASEGHEHDIVAVASGAGNFNTLVAAVKAAGLVETLQGKGPFTVFAPTDDAFKKLPAGTVEMLLKPENKDKLVAILTYHVLPGKVMAADVKTMKAKTVNGQSMQINVMGQMVTVDKAKVIKTDVAASNGVIHVIDHVILPKS
jgi:uncharacterized surface protein with fasciclin (FAS1) repeats